jgi:hypothetical protein
MTVKDMENTLRKIHKNEISTSFEEEVMEKLGVH